MYYISYVTIHGDRKFVYKIYKDKNSFGWIWDTDGALTFSCAVNAQNVLDKYDLTYNNGKACVYFLHPGNK